MSRRRRGHVLRDVVALPWWMGVGVSGIVWVGLRHVIPTWWADEPLLAGLAVAAHRYAPWVTELFLIAAGVSWWRGRARSRDRRQLLDRHTDFASIRTLPWARFEHLVGEAYRRQGYAARENPSSGADGGVDLVLRRDNCRIGSGVATCIGDVYRAGAVTAFSSVSEGRESRS